ncbi:MAG: hypothetical protein ACD_72C00358G0004 [uncultured bacterium]|nr:MAG: hypothetical protein ACD_72C00358G0004 [uncultured bacterium]
MYYLEIFITAALIVWAIYYVISHLTRPFKKDCKSQCEGCDYADSCSRKF